MINVGDLMWRKSYCILINTMKKYQELHPFILYVLYRTKECNSALYYDENGICCDAAYTNINCVHIMTGARLE